jgi:putative ATP-dependent endonuclease of the OLD family
MKIEHVYIHKFRSIESASILVGDVCAIVGENNSGKSSVLRAINAVLNPASELEAFRNNEHHYSPQSKPRIEIRFSEPIKG